MAGRGPRRIRRLITVVAAAGVVTGVTVPSAMAGQATALTSVAAAPAGHSALIGLQASQLNGVACRSARDCLAVGADYRAGTPLAEAWNGTRWRAVRVKLPSGASYAHGRNTFLP